VRNFEEKNVKWKKVGSGDFWEGKVFLGFDLGLEKRG
jgi:hypothetical protein